MTADSDILSKFKLLNETTLTDSSARNLRQEEVPHGIFEGFLDTPAQEDDLFGSFLKKSSESKEKESKQALETYERLDKTRDRKEQREKNIEHKAERFNFIKKALTKLISRTHDNLAKEAFVASENNKETKSKKSKFSVFAQETKFVGGLILEDQADSERRELEDRRSTEKQNWHGVDRRSGRIDRRSEVLDLAPAYNSSLISKVAKISVNNQTSDMASIIKSEELSNNELFELFVNYVKHSVKEDQTTTITLNKVLENAGVAPEKELPEVQMVERTKLENIFLNFIKETASDQAKEAIKAQDDPTSKIIVEFAAAINPEYMTRDELQELFVRYCRLLSVKYPNAFNELTSVLNNALPQAFVDRSGEAHSNTVISNFRASITPEYMTRDELEEIFVRFVREVSINAPEAWVEMQGVLANAVANAFTPDTTMDDQSRSAIANFRMAISPENMMRDQLEELFIRFSREISVKFPAAWAELSGILNAALPNAFTPDTTMDDQSRSAIANFRMAINPENMTRDQLEELFTRFVREVSVKFPAAWAEMQGILNTALPNAFAPDTTMDDASRSAIAGFAQVLKPEFMTRDELEELFIRFSREVSVKFPAAWAELQGILNVALPNVFTPDTTMDDASRFAIAGFAQAIKPEYMTRNQLEELFIRFSREVSIKFPAAWAELQGMLSIAVANAFVSDTTMDDSSRSAIASFSQACKPEYMTRDQLEELFVRCSREISIKFPAAWAELQGMLNMALPTAFVPDTTMDDSSRAAIAGFAQVLKPEYMTRNQLEELFIRFSREVSVQFPAAWAALQSILNAALPNAYVPDTTMDNDTRNLIAEFKSVVQSNEFTEKELEALFANYMRQVPLRFSVVKSIIENTTKNKRGEAETRDKEHTKIDKDFKLIDKELKKTSTVSNELNLEAQQVSKDLKSSDKKEDINENIAKLKKIQTQKSALDGVYSVSKVDMGSNAKATQKINDNYTQKLSISFDRKDDKQLFEIDTEKLTNWDMLRMLRREEVLNIMDELPKEDLVESLYIIPKHVLKRVLTGLTTEDMSRILFNARFPEALLRSMPRRKALELLPSAEEMLPILMNMGQIAGFKDGTELVENVIINSLKVEPEQNPTRTQEEVTPFVMEQLVGKTPRNADAVYPVQGKKSLIDKAMADINEDSVVMNDLTERQNIKDLSNEDIWSYIDAERYPDMEDRTRTNVSEDETLLKQKMNEQKLQNSAMKGKIEYKYQRPESLLPDQLQELAQETLKKFGDDESKEALAAKRGTSKQMLEFLDSLKKVDGLEAAKMAVSVLSVAQTKAVAKAALPYLETKHLIKISQFYGRSNKDMVKEMPRYALEGLIKNLPKQYMIQGFKLLDKSMITGVLKTQSSQTIARVASELLDRNTVKDTAFKKKGFV